MELRKLGQSDLKLPAVSFGAWAIGGWFWGGTDDDAAVRAIQCGIDAGITCVDTAPMYGMGHSERVVGQAIAERRDEVLVATKCGLRWDLEEGESYFDTETPAGRAVKVYRNLRADSIKHECDESLKRLGIDHIDLYQCHWPDSTTPLEDTMGALLDLQQAGKIRAIGVSNFTPEMIERCMAMGTVASDQPKYNALERSFESEMLPFCMAHNIGVLAYSAIAQGLLTGKVSVDRELPEGDHRQRRPWFSRKNRQRVLDMLAKVQPIADTHDATLGQVMINWTFSQPGITSTLVGARNEAQVEENAGAAAFTLSPAEMGSIRTLVEELGAPV